MDEEIKKLISDNLELSRENNLLLKKLVSYQRWQQWLGITKWIIIIGSAVGFAYYLQPVIGNLLGTYNGLLETVSELSVKTLPINLPLDHIATSTATTTAN